MGSRCVYRFAMRLVFVLSLLLLLDTTLHVWRVVNSSQGFDRTQIERHLQKYSFLSPFLIEYGRNSTNAEFSQAVTHLQYAAGLNLTGELDDEALSLVKGRRCGLRDDVTRVRQSEMPLRTRLSPGNDITWSIIRYWKSALQETSGIINRAFRFWEREANLTFKQEFGNIIPLNKCDIQIAFFERFHDDSQVFDGKGDILAHSFYSDERDVWKIHFDTKEEWDLNVAPSAAGTNATNLYAVVLHQIGHTLGLRHSRDPNSIMYPWYKEDETTPPVLSSDDQQEVEQLYSNESFDMSAGDNSTTLNAPDVHSPAECPGSADAVLLAKDHIFVFKDTLYWSMNSEGVLDDKAFSVHQFWYNFPLDATKVDAVYYSRGTKPRVIFFIGDKYFPFYANDLEDGTPLEGRPIADFCVPHSVKKIDAIFVWGHNELTYIISGNMYWSFNDAVPLAQRQLSCSSTTDCTRDVSATWRGIRLPVDAAFTSFDDQLYFFHKEQFWRFDTEQMRIDEDSQNSIDKWLACDPPETLRQDISTHSPNPVMTPGSSAVSHSGFHAVLLALLGVLLNIVCAVL